MVHPHWLALPLVVFSLGAQERAPHRDGDGSITIALTGDSIITRALQPYREPGFLALRDLIRGAGVAFTNLEVLFHEFGPDVIPAEQSGGTYMAAPPRLAGELAWLGFDLVSRANNHTMDWGVGGLRATTRACEAAGLVHAGAGENLARARAPAYLDTPHGRVALLSVASTFAAPMRAGAQRNDVRGRPGLSPLRYTRRYTVPAEQFDALAEIAGELRVAWRRRGAETLRLFDGTVERGEDYAVETRAHEGDLAAITAEVRAARHQANWVIVSSHTHETGRGGAPAEFLVEMARAAIDAGADVVVGHGPHRLLGVEVYQDRPILYSLGNFIFQNQTLDRQPADNYERMGLDGDALPGEFFERRGGWGGASNFESAVAVVEFSAGALREVRLHPITLGGELARPQKGRPLLAGAEQGGAILDGLATLCEQRGTALERRGRVGVVRGAAR